MSTRNRSSIEAPFAPAPEALIWASCGVVGRGRLILFLRLWVHAGVHDLAEIAVSTLAMECGLKVPTAKRDLAWLVANGWVHRIDRPGYTSQFQVRRFKGAPTAPGAKGAPPPPKGAPLGGNPLGEGEIKEEKKKETAMGPPPYIPPPSPLPFVERGTDQQPGMVDAQPLKPPQASKDEDPPRTGSVNEKSTARSTKSRRRMVVDDLVLPSNAPELSADCSELLLMWWRRRCAAHPRADRLALSRFTLQAIELAHQEGVLPDYLNKAIEAGWMSLGHPGTQRLISDLKNANGIECEHAHTGSSMVRSSKPNPGHTGRRQEFLDGVVRLLSPQEDSDAENFQLHPDTAGRSIHARPQRDNSDEPLCKGL